MKMVTEYLKKQITIGDWLAIACIVFLAGGAWWQIDATDNRLTEHIEQEFLPVERKVDKLNREIVPQSKLDDFITRQQYESLQKQNKQDLEALKELMREIQSNTNQRLDYIIERLDEQRK